MVELNTAIEIKFIHLSFETGIEAPHFHEENQLLFFISGKGIETVENKKYKILPGTFILIPEKRVHFFKSTLNKPAEILSLRFKLGQKIADETFTDFFKKTYIYRGGKENIKTIKKMIPSIINGKPNFSFLLKILNMIFETSTKTPEKTTEYMEKLEKYIEENIGSEIKIKKTAEYLGISEVYVRKLVKKIYDISFTKFVNIKKIEYASKLLVETKLPVSKIAGMCGFYDFNYFSRVFKKIKRVSPVKFRKSYL
ncbi:MAG TPA: helix-turn-helix domain-containing protein [bacterium]|nr:helix-turn-helix domain-containing protein [bacterium]HOM26367.1 helix-turn-helix domain-containing protein [bacterium]